jgi:hypothetical protein
MHWIVQTHVFNEERYAEIVGILRSGGIPYTPVRVIPFSDEMHPVPRVENPVAVIGSHGLVRIAGRMGWGPGVFFNDQISFPVYAGVFGRDLLNHDARVSRFDEVEISAPSFLRPTEDDKAFAGMVVTPEDFREWRERVLEIDGFSTVDGGTQVVVASLKEIHAEYRFFVVDRRIVTASRYRLDGRSSPSANVPAEVARAAEGFVEQWQPDRAFVIDLAVTPDGPKIIEFNNINSAGWYHADLAKLIHAIDAMR